LLEEKADPNVQDQNDSTALMWAAQFGCIDSLQALIDKKAEINKQNKIWRMSALHYAMLRKDDVFAKPLLIAGADLELNNENNHTPLLTALNYKNLSAAHLLVEKKANVNVINLKGNTPLGFAIFHTEENLTRAILDAKANLEMDSEDDAPLISAAKKNNPVIAQMLLEAKADLEASDSEKNTSLLIAAKSAHPDMVKVLIEAKANVEAKNVSAESAFLLAYENDDTESMQTLIEAKVDVNLSIIDKDQPLLIDKDRPLLIDAVIKNKPERVQMLIDAKANLHAVDERKDTALIWAAYKGNMPILEILLDAKANIHMKGDLNRTALEQAKKCFKDAPKDGHPKCIARLKAVLAVEPKWHDTVSAFFRRKLQPKNSSKKSPGNIEKDILNLGEAFPEFKSHSTLKKNPFK
jgi:hypothetical protein